MSYDMEFGTEILMRECVQIIRELDCVLTNVWAPDYKQFSAHFSGRCKDVLNKLKKADEMNRNNALIYAHNCPKCKTSPQRVSSLAQHRCRNCKTKFDLNTGQVLGKAQEPENDLSQ